MSATAEEPSGMPPLFDVFGLLRTLWQRRLTILVSMLGAILLAFAYLAIAKPVYTATSTILLDPRDSRATGLDTVLPGIGADSAAISSQVSVIESTDLLNAVFEDLHIADDPEFARGGLLSFGAKPRREAVFDTFRSRVSVDREGLTYVIDVSFKSSDRVKAARIVNAIVDRYRRSLSGEKENANSEANTLLNSRIGDLEKAVSDSEREVQDFKFKNHIFDAGAGGTLQSQIDQVSQQLVTAQDASSRAQTRYDQAVAAGSGPDGLARLSEILNSTTADKLRDDFNQRAAALANSEVVLGPRHPTIAALNAELARIRGLIASEATRITAELKAQRDLAVKNVAQMQAKLAALRDEANQSDLAQVGLRQLQRKADAARAVLDDFLKRSQETQHMEGMQISQVRVLSEAAPPIQATWPKSKLLLVVAAALGLMLGCALALLMGERKLQQAGLFAGWRASRTASRTMKAAPSGTAKELPVLGTIRFPSSNGGLAGAIRALRMEMQRFRNTALLRSIEQLLVAVTDRLRSGTQPPFVLLVSSLRGGGERHLAAAAIGIGLDHIHQTVLVIDLVAGAQTGAAAAAGYRAAAFVDPSSGLRTMIVGAMSAAAPAAQDTSALVDHWVASAGGGPVDFVIVIDRPLGDPGRSAAVGARADLIVFALDAAERQSGSESLGGKLSPAETDRAAVMVVGVSEASAGRQPPQAANRDHPHRAASVLG